MSVDKTYFERSDWLKTHGWNWVWVGPKKPARQDKWTYSLR